MEFQNKACTKCKRRVGAHGIIESYRCGILNKEETREALTQAHGYKQKPEMKPKIEFIIEEEEEEDKDNEQHLYEFLLVNYLAWKCNALPVEYEVLLKDGHKDFTDSWQEHVGEQEGIQKSERLIQDMNIKTVIKYLGECRPHLIKDFMGIVRKQEHEDALKLERFKKAIRQGDKKSCPDEVRDYLDANLPGWRDE